MRILYITPQLPYPPDSGVRVAMLNELQHLSERHAITLVSFVTEATRTRASALETHCDRVITVPHRARFSKTGMLANLVCSRPYTIDRFRSSAMTGQVAALTGDGGVDLVCIHHLHMAQYIDAVAPGVPVALRAHNVESVVMQRFAERATNPLVRAYAAWQARRLRRYEAALCARFDRCIAATRVDARTFGQMAPDARVEAVPFGVDTARFDPSAFPVEPEPGRLVTTGDYGWPPTADGLAFFVRSVFPIIRKAVPDAVLSVVGRDPPASVARMADAGIDIRGRVDDVRPEILRGAVFVAPTRIGSGIRLKILEAMALRRPVVSTPVGCEGIEAEPGRHLLVADTPDAFAACVVRLLRQPEARERLTAAAAALIAERYAWPVLAKRLDAIYECMLINSDHQKRQPL